MESDLSVILMAIVGALIQLVFKYFPKLSDWYETQTQKALIMVGVVFVVSLIYFGFGCVPSLADWLKVQVTCDLPGALQLASAFIFILISQQTTYLLTRKSG